VPTLDGNTRSWPRHIDRGYEGLIDNLVRLGGDVTGIEVDQLG